MAAKLKGSLDFESVLYLGGVLDYLSSDILKVRCHRGCAAFCAATAAAHPTFFYATPSWRQSTPPTARKRPSTSRTWTLPWAPTRLVFARSTLRPFSAAHAPASHVFIAPIPSLPAQSLFTLFQRFQELPNVEASTSHINSREAIREALLAEREFIDKLNTIKVVRADASFVPWPPSACVRPVALTLLLLFSHQVFASLFETQNEQGEEFFARDTIDTLFPKQIDDVIMVAQEFASALEDSLSCNKASDRNMYTRWKLLEIVLTVRSLLDCVCFDCSGCRRGSGLFFLAVLT